jgi:hypothetical protein
VVDLVLGQVLPFLVSRLRRTSTILQKLKSVMQIDWVILELTERGFV